MKQLIIRRLPISDLIVNVLLKIRFFLIRTFFKSMLKDSSPLEKEGRTVFFEDDFTTKKWSHNSQTDWHVKPKWGNFHPASPHQYYSDPLDLRDKNLVLVARHNPKTMLQADYRPDNPKVTIPYEISYIETNEHLKKRYGRFEGRCKMDNHYGTWPAFWLSSANAWPPEIDIFELYGGEKGKGNRILKFNLHYGVVKDNTKSSMRAWGIKIDTFKNFKDSYHEYALEWTPTKMELFIDGIKVFRYTRKDILDKWYNTDKGYMKVILNNGLENTYLDENNPDKDFYSELKFDYLRIYNEK